MKGCFLANSADVENSMVSKTQTYSLSLSSPKNYRAYDCTLKCLESQARGGVDTPLM